MPKVSVIIPCFNQGQFIDEAVDSVLNQTLQDFEIIIVNDGSTDKFTIDKLTGYNKPKCTVIHTENKGLATARNNGIYASTGIYILPLDADDKIGPAYLEKAAKVLDEENEIGIVYCEAEYFGAKNGKWNLPGFSIERILFMNMIFSCALFRKDDYFKTKGFNPDMKYGWEDWDFWLSIIEFGKGVYKLPEVHFFYRIKKDNSMVDELNQSSEKQSYSFNTIYRNHYDFYSDKLGNPIELFSKLKGVQLSLDNVLVSKEYKIGELVLRPYRIVKKLLHKL